MISINRQSDYAIQLVMALAKVSEKAPLSLKKFSIESNISFLFLQRIARTLKKAGLINSSRGMYGGYFLIKDVKKISIKDIVEAVEDGPTGIAACLRGHSCPHEDTCSARGVLNNLNTQLNGILSNMHISDYILK